jgi:hypothetical protein
VGNVDLGVWGRSLSDGYTGSRVEGLLYLKLGSGRGAQGRGDLYINICLQRGHPYSEGGIG